MAAKKTGLGKGLDSLIADKTPKTQTQKVENTDGAVMMNITKVMLTMIFVIQYELFLRSNFQQ